ncbi:MAG: hypothetical protein ACPG32_13105 [Akkermansiaceae bacterium]
MNYLLNRLMMKILLCGMACSGIALYLLKPPNNQKATPVAKKEKVATPDSAPRETSVLKDKPVVLDTVDAEQLPPAFARSLDLLPSTIQANIPHVSQQKSIVVFKNGTSLLIDHSITDPKAHALAELQKLRNKDLKFAVHRVEEQRLIVSFGGGHFYHWVFHEEARMMHMQKVESVKDLLSGKERELLPADWKPSLDAKVGLLARTWLLADINEPVIKKILIAKEADPKKSTASARE